MEGNGEDEKHRNTCKEHIIKQGKKNNKNKKTKKKKRKREMQRNEMKKMTKTQKRSNIHHGDKDTDKERHENNKRE